MSPKYAAPFGIEYALLGFLQHTPLHGYELWGRLYDGTALGRVWRIKQPQLYALLTKLEAAGLVSAEVVAQDTRPPKRLLRLTVMGQAAFHAWLTTPVAHGRDLRIEFLAKLYWVQHNSQSAIQQLIVAQRAAGGEWLKQLINEAAAHDDQPFDRLVVEFRIGQIEAMLRWLDRCEAAFTSFAA